MRWKTIQFLITGLLLGVTGLGFTGFGSVASAGTNIYVGDETPRVSVAMSEIDHSSWNELLAKYVNEDGQVNYRAWRASTIDRKALSDYLNALSTASLRTPRSNAPSSITGRLAFWINAYNAVTIDGILRVYPTASIRNHTAKLFGYNIWDDLLLYVAGDAHSLNQIEHEILRPMGDPRIHFAIVCASTGCPRLLNEAYVGDRIDEQLNRNAKHFFAQQQNFLVRGNQLKVSAILDWFGEDFGASDQAILKRIQPWLSDAQKASTTNLRRLEFQEYDWSLNELR